MKPEEDLESPSEITKLLMAVSQVKQMGKLHEAPEEIFLQVDPETRHRRPDRRGAGQRMADGVD